MDFGQQTQYIFTILSLCPVESDESQSQEVDSYKVEQLDQRLLHDINQSVTYTRLLLHAENLIFYPIQQGYSLFFKHVTSYLCDALVSVQALTRDILFKAHTE